MDWQLCFENPKEAADEIEKLRQQLAECQQLVKEWEEKAATWLASPSGVHRLNGYRELAQKLNVAEMQRDELSNNIIALDRVFRERTSYLAKCQKQRDEALENAQDIASKALRTAWQLGQTYWQQADSEYISHQIKSGETQAKFQQLVDDTRAAIAKCKEES